jgi:hypothetical protein
MRGCLESIKVINYANLLSINRIMAIARLTLSHLFLLTEYRYASFF